MPCYYACECVFFLSKSHAFWKETSAATLSSKIGTKYDRTLLDLPMVNYEYYSFDISILYPN